MSGMYRYDAGYAVEVQQAHRGRFAIVKPVDPDDPAVADVIAAEEHAGRGRHPHHADAGGEARTRRDRLSDSERAVLMGGACTKAYGWSPKKG